MTQAKIEFLVRLYSVTNGHPQGWVPPGEVGQSLGLDQETVLRIVRYWRGGVERYLANYYQPLMGKVFPNARAIAVNLP